MKSLIKNPRITEKASMAQEGNAYVFDVATSATKNEIKKAIFLLYKVKPTKVNMLAIPKKQAMLRGIRGMRGGGKKAVVYLKKDDKIEFI